MVNAVTTTTITTNTNTITTISTAHVQNKYIGRMADTDRGDHSSTSRPRAFEALALRPIYGGGPAAAHSISSSDLRGRSS
jgi:hypothetical protein